ncbi:MAG: serine/threonine-protein phosphatase [Novosphingobium sp.]|nr:serine/threonine-protein phosphatase [Novosphingobium sp.]
MRLKLEASTVTHRGQVRENNEDALCERPDAGLWAVADGMGGHANGDWASSQIARCLSEFPLPGDFDSACLRIADQIHAANQTIYAEAQRRGVQMGSTIVVLHVAGNRFSVSWVGDSRGYLLRDGQLIQLTSDHSQVQELIDRGLLEPEEAKTHRMRHMLSRAIGVQDAVEVDIVVDQTEPGDVFLLCSDGLSGVLTDTEIGEVLRTLGPDQSTDRMLDMVLARGAPDNVSIVAIGIRECTEIPASAGTGGANL